MNAVQTKDARFDVRVAAEQKEKIERAAYLSGLSLSEFVVSTSLAAASEVLQRQNQMTLSERDWQQFRAALEADDEPTEAAKKAAERYNQGRADGAAYEW